jgi:hypothetical protein
MNEYPVAFDAAYPERTSRWKALLRLPIPFLAIPPLIMLVLVGYGIGYLLLGVGLYIIVRGRYPRWLFDFTVAYSRWRSRVMGYILMASDQYPPLEGQYPVNFDVRYQEPMSRGLFFILKWIMLIPHYILLALLFIVAVIVTILAWFAVLFTGRYPRSLFGFMVGYGRWVWRVTAYFFLMTDRYPPLSFM